MPNANERFVRLILAATRNLASAIESLRDEQMRSISARDITTREDYITEAIGLLRDIRDGLNTVVAESNTQGQDSRSFSRKSLVVQWCLFLATAGAFGAAEHYAKIAKLQKETMERQWSVMHEQLVEIGKQTPSLAKAAEAAQVTAIAARDALAATLDISRDDQRAWVSLDGIDVVFDSTTGTRVKLHFTNTGKTPALKVRSAFDIQVLGQDVHPILDKYLREPRGSPIYLGSHLEGVISPMGGASVTGDPKDTMIPERDIQLIRAKVKRFYITGSIWYEDVFRRPHITTYCDVYYPATSTFDPCFEGHNTAN
jgi:hypothetical protein